MPQADGGSSSITKSGVTLEAENLRKTAKNVRAELDNLDAKVAQLRNQWSGAAQVAYNDAHTNWTKKTDEMNQLLDRIGAKAIELAGRYGDQDNHSAKRFSRGD